MKRQWLHDAAKFAAGLIFADFIIDWWLSGLKVLPKMFLGLPVSASMIGPSMALDFFIFLVLVHYAWNIGRLPQMRERVYLTIVGIVFTLVAGVHLFRILYQADVNIFGWDVPVFLSWFGVAITTYLAYASFHFAARMNRR